MNNKTIENLEKDIIILALRLRGEDPDTFSPEVYDVMSRWKNKVEEKIDRR